MLWISTTGGPLVVLPKAGRSEWRGASDAGSDYELACSVDEYAGIVHWGNRDLLVLGDEPLQTAVRVGEGRVTLIRWMFSPDEKSILECLEPDTWEEPIETLRWVVSDTEHVLCDSAVPGKLMEEGIEIRLDARPHKVLTYLVRPVKDVGAVIHDIHPC